MKTQEKINELANAFKKKVDELGYNSSEYCILMKYGRPGQVHKIYSSITGFKEKGLADAEKVDPMYNIDFQIWYYD